MSDSAQNAGQIFSAGVNVDDDSAILSDEFAVLESVSDDFRGGLELRETVCDDEE